MSPKDVSSGSGAAGAFTPGRIAVTALAVLAIVFICVNTAEVTIRVIVPKVTMPLWAALLGMFVAGLLCGAMRSAVDDPGNSSGRTRGHCP
ncbi:LapA family protein [Streptomyces sp. M10(2022)]